MALGQITRYVRFLEMLHDRHRANSDAFVLQMEQMHSVLSKSGEITAEQAEYLQICNAKQSVVELDIESYYLFAKILLDRVARFVEFYFGPARNLSLDSHGKMTRNFGRYAADRGLHSCERVDERLRSLKVDISDYRDYQIAHHKNPRTIRGLLFHPDEGVAIVATNLYPAPEEKQVQSVPLAKISDDIDKYLEEVISLLCDNRDRTILRRDQAS